MSSTRGAKMIQMVLDKDSVAGREVTDSEPALAINQCDSESELDSEQERIANEMEEFIDFESSGSEYNPPLSSFENSNSSDAISVASTNFEFIQETVLKENIEGDKSNEASKNETSLSSAPRALPLVKPSSIVPPSILDYELNYMKKGTARERPTICPICYEDVQTHFTRHLFRRHKDNKEVIAIQNLKPKSKERLDLVRSLRKQGYFHMKTEKNVLQPMRTSKNPDTEYFVCTYCLGHYTKKLLYKHVKICINKPSDVKNAGKNCLTRSQTFMASVISKNHDYLKSSRIKEEVFNIMRPDNISSTAKNDPLICLYAESLLNKHKRKQIAIVISNKMREMGRLLVALKTVDNEISGLFDALKPENFRSFLSATKIISGYDPNNKSFVAPSLALHMGTNLKFLCDIALKIVLENKQLPNIQWTDRQQKKNNIKDLKKLIEGHWCHEISSLALKSLKEKHWEKPVQLPLNSDIQLFKTYVNRLADDAYTNLGNNLDLEKNYKILTECVLAETLMFNRKRVGEIQYLMIENYNSNSNTVNQESFMDSLTKVEQLLSKRFKRVVAGGKGFKPVPILFSRRIQLYIDGLLRVRQEFDIVPKSNPYLFANPGSEDRWMSGASIMRKFAQKCGAKEPSLLTSTRFRKHIATTLQLMSMEDNEMEQIATFMGHTKKTHLEFYRLPQDIYQTAKVAKVLLLLEKGKGKEFKGKSLKDIELDDVYYTTESEKENEESDDGKPLSEKILKKVARRPRQQNADCGGTTIEVPLKSYQNIGCSANTEDDYPVTKKKKIETNERQSLSKTKTDYSSDEEDSSMAKRKLKKSKTGGRVRWSEREKQLVTRYFQEHIKKKIAPKKHECSEFLAKHQGIFIDKNWVRVKTFVYNCYRDKQRD